MDSATSSDEIVRVNPTPNATMTDITLFLDPHCAQYISHLMRCRLDGEQKIVASSKTIVGKLLILILEEAEPGYLPDREKHYDGKLKVVVQVPSQIRQSGKRLYNRNMVLLPDKMFYFNGFINDMMNHHMASMVRFKGRMTRKEALIEFRTEFGITEDSQPLDTALKRVYRIRERGDDQPERASAVLMNHPKSGPNDSGGSDKPKKPNE